MSSSLAPMASTDFLRHFCDTEQSMQKGPRLGALAFCCKTMYYMAALARLEHATNGLGNRCSIHLSYRAAGNSLEECNDPPNSRQAGFHESLH